MGRLSKEVLSMYKKWELQTSNDGLYAHHVVTQCTHTSEKDTASIFRVTEMFQEDVIWKKCVRYIGWLEAVLPIKFSCEPVHVPGFSGSDTDTVEHNLMGKDNAVFSYSWLHKPHKSAVAELNNDTGHFIMLNTVSWPENPGTFSGI